CRSRSSDCLPVTAQPWPLSLLRNTMLPWIKSIRYNEKPESRVCKELDYIPIAELYAKPPLLQAAASI
ncbi:MAG: hypothetical protein ACE5JL_12340, partial [Dehalococcoidia bacterium]